MRTETEWNYDRSEFRCLIYRGDELVDVSAWSVLRPFRFVGPGIHPITRLLVVPVGLIVLEILVLLVF